MRFIYFCFFFRAGDIPHELSALSNLKVLYLNNNGLSGKACGVLRVVDGGFVLACFPFIIIIMREKERAVVS